ncbi:XRE family transcriptional regulator [Streptomyces sp. T1317-0309]|nr:XRE family transcriptional regulator [Streptomyces sp. T1317-0309]
MSSFGGLNTLVVPVVSGECLRHRWRQRPLGWHESVSPPTVRGRETRSRPCSTEHVVTDDLYRRLGAYLRTVRQSRGIAQEDLARAVKLTRGSIANLEAGRQRIQVHTLIAACHALGLDPADALARALEGEMRRRRYRPMTGPGLLRFFVSSPQSATASTNCSDWKASNPPSATGTARTCPGGCVSARVAAPAHGVAPAPLPGWKGRVSV